MDTDEQLKRERLTSFVQQAVKHGVIFEDPNAKSIGSAMVFYALGDGVELAPAMETKDRGGRAARLGYSSGEIETNLAYAEIECNNRSGIGLQVCGKRAGTIDRQKLKDALLGDEFEKLFPTVAEVMRNYSPPTPRSPV